MSELESRSEELARAFLDSTDGEYNLDIVCASLHVIRSILAACPVREELSEWIEAEMPHVLMTASQAGAEYDRQGSPVHH